MTHTHLTQQTRLLLSDSRRGSAPSPAFLTLAKGNASHPAAGARNPAGSPGSSLSLLLASPGHQMQGSPPKPRVSGLRAQPRSPRPTLHLTVRAHSWDLTALHTATPAAVPPGTRLPRLAQTSRCLHPGAYVSLPLTLQSHTTGLHTKQGSLSPTPGSSRHPDPPPLGHDSVLAPQLPRGRPPTPPAFPETQFGPPDVCCDPRRRLSQLRSRRRNCLQLPALRVPEAGGHLPPASRAPAQPPTRSKPSLGATPVTDARQTVTAPRKSRVRGRRQGG